jgi:hypothetical protein
MQPFDIQIMINHLQKQKQKTITTIGCSSLTNRIFDQEIPMTKIYKAIYYLKQKRYLHSIKKDLYLIANPMKDIPIEETIEWLYRPLLLQHCKEQFGSQRYIWWEAALQLYMQHYSIPDAISIYNCEKVSKETIIQWKIAYHKTYFQQWNNISKQLIKLKKNSMVYGLSFPLAPIELAILEGLHNNNYQDRMMVQIVEKLLKKHKQLDISLINTILKTGKHQTTSKHLLALMQQLWHKDTAALQAIVKQRLVRI